MDDHVLQLIDDLGLSIDEINELYAGYEKLQKADLSITKKDYQERITAVMADLDADLSNIETVLKSNFSDVLSMAEDAEEA